MTEKLLVPDIGDFENVEVIELLVKEGQEIQKNDPVITIESDKSSVEIPSTFSGKIETIKVKVGDKVSKGDLILNISNFNQPSSASKVVPKDTENLIQEAENALKKTQEQETKIKKKEKPIQWIKKKTPVNMATGGLMSMPPFIAKQEDDKDKGISPYDINTPSEARQVLPSRLLAKSRTRFNKGGFPDLSGDGKTTMKDVLIGRGVLKKEGGSKMQKKKLIHNEKFSK